MAPKEKPVDLEKADRIKACQDMPPGEAQDACYDEIVDAELAKHEKRSLIKVGLYFVGFLIIIILTFGLIYYLKHRHQSEEQNLST